MAKKKKQEPEPLDAAEQTAGDSSVETPPPHFLEQSEAPDVDARLDGEQPLGRTVDGTEPDEAQQPLPGDHGSYPREAVIRAYHSGYEQALRDNATLIDGMHFLKAGKLLAEGLDANNLKLNAKLAALAEAGE